MQSTIMQPHHTLRDQICEFNDVLESHDFIKKTLDPFKFNKISVGAEVIDTFNKLKLYFDIERLLVEILSEGEGLYQRHSR